MADLRFDSRMSDVESLIWALEARDPQLRSTITAVAVLESSPGVGEVRARVDRLTRAVPRLRDRVVEIGAASPQWDRDPDFDLDFHLRCVRAPLSGPEQFPPAPGSVPRVVLDLAAPFAAEGLDRSRSPWQMLWVEDLPGGGAALIMKLHHSFTDGIGALRLAAELFDLEADAPARPAPALPARRRVAHPLARLAGDLAQEARRSLDAARAALGAAATDLWAAAGDPRDGAARRLELVGSLAELAAPGSAPLSNILTGRSVRCRFEAIAVPFDDLRRAGKAAGGTVNDAFVAGLVAGLRRYHAEHGSRAAALRVAVPVSTREGEGDASMRNAFVPVRITVPLQGDDPAERIRTVHDLVLRQRRTAGFAAIDPVAVAAKRVPALRGALAGAMGGVDLVASNIPGADVPLHLAGCRVRSLIPFGPRNRSALNCTVLSFDGMLGIGVNIDPVAAPDHGRLLDALRAGLAEILSVRAGGG